MVGESENVKTVYFRETRLTIKIRSKALPTHCAPRPWAQCLLGEENERHCHTVHTSRRLAGQSKKKKNRGSPKDIE